MNQLVRLDSTSLNRALLGFDKDFENFENRFGTQNTSYPPYNILKKTEDSYELQLAVSGFEPSDISVELNQSILTVKGEHKQMEPYTGEYLHRGLASRNFVRSLQLAEYMEVGVGRIKNGILFVEIKRVIPEALKPRTIQVTAE